MAAGRPAIFVGPRHCESADAIRTAGCGITVDRGDVDGLVAALTDLAADPSLSRRMGERGRSAFLAGYEKRLCCGQWHDLLAELTRADADPARPAPTSRRPSTVGRTATAAAVAALSIASNLR
jgi:colanic acid biosynthesis glycosyl transferase WcaI